MAEEFVLDQSLAKRMLTGRVLSMAPPTSCKLPFALLASLLLIPLARAAGVICEDLSNDECAFAISSSSKRCVLESYQHSGAPTEYKCRSSEVGVPKMANYIESDECIGICGVSRDVVGISSDALLELDFEDRLCSPECFQNCPSIIDLYYNLAAGEGVHLPDLCQARRSQTLRSSGGAPGPGSAAAPRAAAPGPSSANAPGPVTGRDVSPSGASPAAAPSSAPARMQDGAGAGDDDDVADGVANDEADKDDTM